MKRSNHLNFLLIAVLLMGSAMVRGQEKYYQLTKVNEIETSDSKALKRVGSCWSNAGASFLEAELIRLGKQPVDMSEMHFVHSAYVKKAYVYLNENELINVDPSGTAYDVITLAGEYGIVPESEFMYAQEDMNTPKKQGEMDAILRGTLNMISQKGEGFSERWQNIYSTSLLRYMGESKIEFSVNNKSYTPKSFSESLGLPYDDYAVLSAIPNSEVNSKVDPGMKQNWAGTEFYNLSQQDIAGAIQGSIENGFTVVWYGLINNSNIFAAENMAIVPAGDMPAEKPEEETEGEEIEYKPIAEKTITPEMRAGIIPKVLQRDQEFLLIYGMKTDQEDNIYFTAKYVCKSGNQTLDLSIPFVELNTIYMMVNKNGLPSELKGKL